MAYLSAIRPRSAGLAPICTAKRTLMRAAPSNHQAALDNVWRIGPNQRLLWQQYDENGSDIFINGHGRLSDDLGVTWGAPFSLPNTRIVNGNLSAGWSMDEAPNGETLYHPESGLTVQCWLRDMFNASLFLPHTFLRSTTDGQNWSFGPITGRTDGLLTYEACTTFNPADPMNAGYLAASVGYGPNSIKRLTVGPNAGKLLVVCSLANDPNDGTNATRQYKLGALCYLLTWNAGTRSYDVQAGTRTFCDPNTSTRAFLEPEALELANGDILVLWRTSGNQTAPSPVAYYSISHDGGMTLSQAAVMDYDNNTPFFKPSSWSRMLRGLDGKPYILLNINPKPVGGNNNRFPLMLALLRETGTPAILRNSVTSIDDRLPGDLQGLGAVQISNFSAFTDETTGGIRLHYARYGTGDPGIVSANYAPFYRMDVGLR